MIFLVLLTSSVALAAHIKTPRRVSSEVNDSPYDHPEVSSYDVPIYTQAEEATVEDQPPSLNEIPHISTTLELPKENPRIPPEPTYTFGSQDGANDKTITMVEVPVDEFKLDEHMYDVPKVLLALEPDKYRPSYFEEPSAQEQDYIRPITEDQSYNFGDQPPSNVKPQTAEEPSYNFNSQPQSSFKQPTSDEQTFTDFKRVGQQQQTRHYSYHFKNTQNKSNRFNFKATSSVFDDNPIFSNLDNFFNRNGQFPLLQHSIEPLTDFTANSNAEDGDKFVTVIVPKDAKKWRYDWLYKYHV